jgi:Uma2 family endonuclease
MNVQPQLRMDKPEFLAWVQTHEGRYEIVGNRVVMMIGGSRGHAFLVRRLAAALEKRLGSSRWMVLTSDFGVDVGPSDVRYPDVVVDVAGGRFRDLTATAPVLIAEVLSPSSAKDDVGVKANEYIGVPSLSAYLVIEQEVVKARIWVRGAEGFSTRPKVIEGREAAIEITPLDMELPLAEIYAGVQHP